MISIKLHFIIPVMLILGITVTKILILIIKNNKTKVIFGRRAKTISLKGKEKTG